jgi:ABC-type transport system involved in cytochrome bd biosynthesis fused ATPase/permease subunit
VGIKKLFCTILSITIVFLVLLVYWVCCIVLFVSFPLWAPVYLVYENWKKRKESRELAKTKYRKWY